MIRFLHTYRSYRLLGQPLGRALRSAWRMTRAVPAEDRHGPMWPLLMIGALCLIPAALVALGTWLFSWRVVLIAGGSYLVGNATWAIVAAMLRRTRT